MTRITIDPGHARPAAPDLYGLFFEDINRAGDSGLYPEMLRNRSFEDSLLPAETQPDENGCFVTKTGYHEQFFNGEGTALWAQQVPPTPIPAWYTQGARMTLDQEDTLNPRREAALAVHFEAGGTLCNIGFHGIPAKQDEALLFYAFWKAQEPVTLQVRLIGSDGTILADAPAQIPAGDYARTDLRLVPNATDTQASLVISSDTEAQVKLGFTSLLPEETFLGHGLRKDLVELLQMTHSKFMRFPGGCVVEGLNDASAMRFTDTVGPVWERVTTWDLWHYRTTNGFGFHEFLQLCEDLSMEALYVVNCGMTCQARKPDFYEGERLEEMLSQTFMALEYAMGGTDTHWGALRAEMGHPEPFCIKYIEIGNENDGPEYDKRYKIFYDRLQEAYPQIILISNAHTENRGLPTQFVDEHYYFDWQFFAQSGHLYDHYPKDGPKVFLGEYAVTRGVDVGTLRSALAETCFLMGTENNPEVVKLTAYAPLFENIHYTSWRPNLIFFDNHRAAGLPVLHALGMLGESRGTRVLNVRTDAEQLQPEKYGFAGFVSYQGGVRIKHPVIDGEVRDVTRQILGGWIYDGDEMIADPSVNDPVRLDSVTRYPIQMDLVNSVFTTRKSHETDYSVQVFIDRDTPKFVLTLWVHNTREPGMMELTLPPDAPAELTGPRSHWGLGDMEYYGWVIENGTGRGSYLYRYQEHPLSQPVELPIRYGEFNEFTLKATATGYDCWVNGEYVGRVEDRKYGRIETIVTEDEQSVYIKLLNQSDRAETAVIECPIPVQSSFGWKQISGEPDERNSLEEPERIAAVSGSAEGAGREFVFETPAWSFTVLRLDKIPNA